MDKQQYISLVMRWHMLVEDAHNEYAKDSDDWRRSQLRNLASIFTFHIAWFDGAAAMTECGSEEEYLAASLGLLAVNALSECRELLKNG